VTSSCDIRDIFIDWDNRMKDGMQQTALSGFFAMKKNSSSIFIFNALNHEG